MALGAEADLSKAGTALIDMGIDWVIIKDGANGSLLISSGSDNRGPGDPSWPSDRHHRRRRCLRRSIPGFGGLRKDEVGAAVAGAAAAARVIEGIGARSRS